MWIASSVILLYGSISKQVQLVVLRDTLERILGAHAQSTLNRSRGPSGFLSFDNLWVLLLFAFFRQAQDAFPHLVQLLGVFREHVWILEINDGRMQMLRLYAGAVVIGGLHAHWGPYFAQVGHGVHGLDGGQDDWVDRLWQPRLFVNHDGPSQVGDYNRVEG